MVKCSQPASVFQPGLNRIFLCYSERKLSFQHPDRHYYGYYYFKYLYIVLEEIRPASFFLQRSLYKLVYIPFKNSIDIPCLNICPVVLYNSVGL